MRKLLAILVLVAVVVFLAACRNVANGPAIYIPPEGPIQLEDPQIGDTIAIIHTNLGDITIRLFPQYAPRAVENFTTLAESGWYDGLTFYRVLQEFVIQAGQPNTQYSIWSGPFMAEWDAPLHHIRGAVGLAAYMGLSVSSFYIVQNSDMDNETPMRHNFRHYIENPDTVLYDADGNPFIIT
ncbi:MAG: peptidylprolyl isomerase, partial [Clostridiales bacterium]|nr:peptidylprolyl isomerase [Clostridiales bacterium]